MRQRRSENRRILVLFLILGLLTFVGGILAYFLVSSSGLLKGIGQATPTSGTQMGKPCGVKKNTDGTYSFPWLHVSSDGKIVNQAGCYVPLAGFNMGGLFLGDAGVGDVGVEGLPKKIAWYKQTFQMNIVRINFNSQWWVDDVLVPKANMHFRQWLQLNVKLQEQSGNYVELDEGPHFPEPPCGGSVKFCPAQDQAVRDYQANPNAQTAKELETNIAPGLQAWTDLAKLYANDPAVLYDALNEPTLKDLPTFFKNMNTIIDTIRAQNPRSLIIVYENGLKDIMGGNFPNYKQSNLVFDAHIYDGFRGISPATGKQCNESGKRNWTPTTSNFGQAVNFAQSHGQAVMVGEWGGCYLLPDYNQQITTFAKARGIPLVYFFAGFVADSTKDANFQINDNGRLVQADYASIMAGVSDE